MIFFSKFKNDVFILAFAVEIQVIGNDYVSAFDYFISFLGL